MGDTPLPKVTFRVGDISSSGLGMGAFRGLRIDAHLILKGSDATVYHHRTAIHLPYALENDEEILEVNLLLAREDIPVGIQLAGGDGAHD